MMLIQLIAVVVRSFFFPLLAIAANRVPMKMGISSFKVMADVAMTNICGVTVGNVEIAPLEIEYGNGHSRIIISNFRPSRLSTEEKASKRLSLATNLCTKPEKIVREVKNEHVDPATVAVEMISHLQETSLVSHDVMFDRFFRLIHTLQVARTRSRQA